MGDNNWFLNSRPTVDSIKNIFLEYIHRKLTIIIMKVAICFTCVFAMAYAESWIAAQPEPQTQDSTLEADHPQAAATTMPTQDSSLAMELLMPVLPELQLDLPANILPTRSSTHAPEVVLEIRTQTTEFLVVTLEISFWELLVDLLLLLLLMLLLEVLVEENFFFDKI